MATPTYDSVQLGDVLPPLDMAPIYRGQLALFAGASGDHNPIHIDMDFARKAGMPDVFAHGMLGMAWVGRLVTQWAPTAELREFNVRFAGITHLGNAVRCAGSVTEKLDGKRVRVALQSANQFGQTKIVGEAVVALP